MPRKVRTINLNLNECMSHLGDLGKYLKRIKGSHQEIE